MQHTLIDRLAPETKGKLAALVSDQIDSFLRHYNAEEASKESTTLYDRSILAYDTFVYRDDAVLRIHNLGHLLPRPHKLDRYYKPSKFGFQTPDQLLNALDVICNEIGLPKAIYKPPESA